MSSAKASPGRSSYQAVWYQHGRDYRETFGTREQAQDKLGGVKTLVAPGQSPASLRERGREAFGVVATQWLASRHDLKTRTLVEYANLLSADLSISATFDHRPVN